MRNGYRNSPLSEEDLSAASSEESNENFEEDEWFGSACSNYSDCEYCCEERRRRQANKNHLQSTGPMTPTFHLALDTTDVDNLSHLHTCSYKARKPTPYHLTACCYRVETTPLLASASHKGYKSATSSSDTLGAADLSSKAVLSTYRKLQKLQKAPKKQSSLVTIFSVWNTTMGSSLLAMAWGVERAGLAPALALLVAMGGLCLYTAWLLLTVNKRHGGLRCEVPALCHALLGAAWSRAAHAFSLLVLAGANIVYWILITNFLYFTVNYFVELNSPNTSNSSVYCPPSAENASFLSPPVPAEVQDPAPLYWRLHGTVPLYVAFIVFPLLNFRSATFFTKFNSLGTLSVVYLLFFVVIKGALWGVNYTPALVTRRAGAEAAVLSGMLALSFYIHNIIITIMNANERQDKNGRDLTIAFVLVTLTYVLVGAGFYICFPLLKTCIQDNMLNNFEMHDVMTAVARILLLFQVITVYPLVAFMLRTEAILLLPLSKAQKQSRWTTVIINVVIVTICILFACFCPNIGTIIRYTGAVSGLVHIFALPSLLQLRSLHLRGELTVWKIIFYGAIIAIGTINLIMQFFISE